MERWLVLLALGACATPYQPKGVMGGYSDSQIDENTFYVTFSGNGYTGVDDAQHAVLRRAGELCPHGFDILRAGAESVNTGTQVTVNRSAFGTTATASDINKPQAGAVVRCRGGAAIQRGVSGMAVAPAPAPPAAAKEDLFSPPPAPQAAAVGEDLFSPPPAPQTMRRGQLCTQLGMAICKNALNRCGGQRTTVECMNLWGSRCCEANGQCTDQVAVAKERLDACVKDIETAPCDDLRRAITPASCQGL